MKPEDTTTPSQNKLEWKPRPSRRLCTWADAVRLAPQGWRLPTGQELERMIKSRKLRRTQSYWTSCYWDGWADALTAAGPFLALRSRCLVENGQVDQMDLTGADNDREGTVAWYCRDLPTQT